MMIFSSGIYMPNRRTFLKNAAAAAGFPMIVKSSVLGLQGAVPPSDRVNIATIGVGWMGGGHVDEFLRLQAAHYVVVCDIDKNHLAEAKAKIDKKYGNKDCLTFHKFEEVIVRKDIDAVSMACPDHWHGLVSVAALKAGKDVYGEKPLAHNFHEGLMIVKAVAKGNRIWQTGSWQRSRPNFRRAVELVRNGRIGKIKRVEVGLPGGHTDFAKTKDKTAFTPAPPELDYDRWLGPAPVVPYCEARVHKNWRWNLAFGGGQLMDWVGHHVDIAHWGMDWDSTGPHEIEGVGEYPPKDALWNTATKYRISAKYPGGVEFIIAGGHRDIRGGTKWIGEEGWVWVDRSGLEASSESILKSEIKASEVQIPKSPGHYQEFIESVRSRKETLTPARVAIRSATPGWLGQIAMLTQRKLQWDPVKQRIVNDKDAAKLLSRNMRAPWKL